MHYVIWIILVLSLIYVGVLCGFYWFQDGIIFRQSKLHSSYEFEFQRSFEEYKIEVSGSVKLSTVLLRGNSDRGVVFYNHGNTGNIQDWGNRVEVFLELGYDVFLYDYRGYGKSEGRIRKESVMHKDARKLYDFLVKKYDPEKIIIYGISLGSGVASKLATKRPCKSLILETPFFNFHSTIRELYPFLPVSIISKYHFRTDLYLRNLEVPIYIFHGTDDRVISHESSLRLRGINDNIVLYSFKGGGHSNLVDFPLYTESMRKILS